MPSSFVQAASGGYAPNMRHFSHHACIDWSGARGEYQPGIAVAVASGGGAPEQLRPKHRWSRAEILKWLQQLVIDRADILVGVDFSAAFAFADCGAYFPQWSDSPADARALWALVEQVTTRDPHFECASFLAHPEAHRHFRHSRDDVGDLFGGGIGRLRLVEHHQRATKQANSWSNFNLVGAGQVGKASLSGMRLLHRLSPALPIWPFDPLPARGPAIVEIYTSMAARAAGITGGRSKIRTGEALDVALRAIGSPPACHKGAISDHASDALLTAAWLRGVADDSAKWSPSRLSDTIAQTEGWTFGVN